MNHITYEHPVKEHIKTLLRLEQLFNQYQTYLEGHQGWPLTPAIQTLIAILKIAERPDIKSKLTKHLHQQYLRLETFLHHPRINQKKLEETIEKIATEISKLKLPQGLVADQITCHPLLKKIKNEMNAGGMALVGEYSYLAWQQQDTELTLHQLNEWGQDLIPLNTLVEFTLNLCRQSKPFKLIHCENKFYSQALNPSLDLSLIRIKLPNKPTVIPEISAGKHHLAIHFKEVSITLTELITNEKRIKQFELACCS